MTAPDLTPSPILVDGKTAAAMLGIGHSKLKELVTMRKIRSKKVGQLRLYRPADLEAFAEQLPDAS